MALEDIGRYQQPQQQQDETALSVQQDAPYQPYMSPYDPYGGKLHSGLDAQMLEMVIKGDFPEDPTLYPAVFNCLVNAASSNPNCTEGVILRWNRDFADVDDRAHSQGMKKVTAAKARKLFFEIRSYIARGDNPMIGLSGVGAAITSFQKQEQTIRMPTQERTNQAGNSVFGFLNPLNWGKR